jgi:hypothetical protein
MRNTPSRNVVSGFSRPDVENSTNALDRMNVARPMSIPSSDVAIRDANRNTAPSDRTIDTASVVKNASRVTLYAEARSSSHSGCVNACTRSSTFQRKP